jgi:hypothetical protein
VLGEHDLMSLNRIFLINGAGSIRARRLFGMSAQQS